MQQQGNASQDRWLVSPGHLATWVDHDDLASRTPVLIGMARGLIRSRRERERMFPADLFADPAWDILLDLTIARLEGKTVSVLSLCLAAPVPTTTAFRWIRRMEAKGLLIRSPDQADRRRIFVDLSEEMFDTMVAYLDRTPASETGRSGGSA